MRFAAKVAIIWLFGLAWHACGAFSAVAEPIAAVSQWVRLGPDGKLVYKTTPRGDRIMDFSSAGYMGGGVALPSVPVKRSVKPSGGADDTAAIQDAIDAVSAMPAKNGFRGAVLLAPGTYTCARTIYISADGVVLRGSGTAGRTASTFKMTGSRHCAIVMGRTGGGQGRRFIDPAADGTQESSAATAIADAYVPAGTRSFTVANPAGLAAGDTIGIVRPVTRSWLHFMHMDDLQRNGRPQTWIREGSHISEERTIAAISDKTITVDIPLSDSFDARYLNPPGTAIVKTILAPLLKQAGVEQLHVQCPAMKISYTQHPYTALRLSGQDCWAKDLLIEETMNSVSVSGRRITLREVTVNHTFPNVGSSKPAEFAPNASQILLDRCGGNGDNIWYAATGGEQAGPIVLLNCAFRGNGHIEGHQRWTTGILLDNCQVSQGGIDFKNRGAMGSGHGWAVGWSVAWNLRRRDLRDPTTARRYELGHRLPRPKPADAAAIRHSAATARRHLRFARQAGRAEKSLPGPTGRAAGSAGGEECWVLKSDDRHGPAIIRDFRRTNLAVAGIIECRRLSPSPKEIAHVDCRK